MMPRDAVGECFICHRPVVARPYVEQRDGMRMLVLHFTCYTAAEYVLARAWGLVPVTPTPHSNTRFRLESRT